jgi:hypothetical protein
MRQATAVLVVKPLTDHEEGELTHHVQAVYRAMFAFGLTAGEHLYHIHNKRLYRSHGSFDDFVWQTFHFHAKRAYQFIRAYKVLRILEDAGVARLPVNESQCRPLYRLIDQPNKLVKAWKGRPSTTVDSVRAHTSINNDYWPTPIAIVRDLFDRETFAGSIWDCAAGDGRILRVARERYPTAQIVGTDISAGTDFLTVQGMTADNIITNPPFTLKNEFVWRALELARKSAVILLPIDFLTGQKRFNTIYRRRDFRLTTLWVHVRPIKWAPHGSIPGFPLAWFVWRKRTNQQSPVIKWIE